MGKISGLIENTKDIYCVFKINEKKLSYQKVIIWAIVNEDKKGFSSIEPVTYCADGLRPDGDAKNFEGLDKFGFLGKILRVLRGHEVC